MNDQGSGQAAAGWQAYRDPRFGFQVSLPPGWSIYADEQAIQMWSPDSALFALVVPFRPAPQPMQIGMAATDNGLGEQIARLPQIFPRIFPQLRIQRITPPSAAGGDSAGEFLYPFGQSAGSGRVLCSRNPQGGGMLFVIAAPLHRFEEEMPLLLSILRGLIFPGPAGPTPAGERPGSSPQAASSIARAIDEAAKSLQWVSWSDPRENAFHIEAPQGWAVEGGAFRHGLMDTRMAVQIRSPDSKVIVQSGDPNLTLFSEPTPIHMQMGMREGQFYSPTGTFQSMLLRPMPARAFARWYCQNFLGSEVEGLTPVSETDQPEASRQQTAIFQQRGMPGHVEVVLADFKGRSRRTGLPVSGQLMVTVTYFAPLISGPTAGGLWCAQPVWSLSAEDNDPKTSEALMATAGAVVLHVLQSWRDDAVWTARNNQMAQAQNQAQAEINQQISRQSHANAMENIRQAGERSRQMARDSDQRRQASMDAFHQRMDAQDHATHNFVNYIRDRTDVVDTSTGQAWNVPTGSQNYYRNESGDMVLGTDAPYSPGVNWTLLKEL